MNLIRRATAAALIAALLIPHAAFAAPAEAPRKGIWITCLGKANVLGSRESIDQAVSFAKQGGFKMLFVQVFRADKAWFDSKIADNSPFKKNRAAVKADAFQLLIDRAHAQGIEVHAWINTLTLSQSEDAKVLKQYGKEILTKDQHGRPAFSKTKDATDKHYEREGQLFLEPGDWRVRQHVIGIVKELAAGYPALDGIHFDYIRYPAAPPYLPGSKFNAVGLTYGYGERNVKAFKAEKGIDPHQINWKPEPALVWDNWRRQQVTRLIADAGREARALNPKIRISSAVIAAFDRAYFAACQEWPRWIENGTVDFVVLMNYSKDSNYVRMTSRAAQGLAGDPRKIYVGIGAWMMDKEPSLLALQLRQTASSRSGVVLFDYDSIIETPELKKLFLPAQATGT